MRIARFIGSITLAALPLSIAACALVPQHAKLVQIRPVKEAASADLSPDDRYYEAAAAAIIRRDYAEALDDLQAARARKPDDIRVLNAFGVVYDKLGRFDLSARYYAQAKVLDPGSEIVSNNIAYSLAMQSRAGSGPVTPAGPVTETATRPLDSAPAQPAPKLTLALGPELPLRLAAKTAPPTGVIGHPLVIVDASGRPGGAEPVRTQLVRLGWSAPRSALRIARSELQTTIRYAPAGAVAARALARTLPKGARLVACADACAGVRLTIGADAAAWTFQAHRPQRTRS
jgi:tetratricopeptide (TPR) repeat protein